MMDLPTPQSYLNYQGDRTASDDLQVGRAMGPTTYGGLEYVVGHPVYDPKTDMTRVPMSAVRPS